MTRQCCILPVPSLSGIKSFWDRFLVGRLTGIEEVKVEAIAMSKLHNMSCPPYMGHSAAVIFHLIYLS
ncbi:hypothetical protein AWP95_12970 [Escherichia coli]|nr:hypothetical protein AWP95_12970 [Escherichia coli]